MTLEGFDTRFADLPDYILGVTHEIWESRGIATLHNYYASDIVVRSPGSIVIGNAGVIAATLATLAEFPDRQLLGEDVIWCGSPETGLLSSHRILSTATHTGDGVYGPASGKALRYRIIADCHVRANRIDDEWLIRDQSAVVQQLGWTLPEYARSLIAREGGADHCIRPFRPEQDQSGPYTGQGNHSPWGEQLVGLLTAIMSAELSVIPRGYDRAAHLEYPGHLTVHGHAEADRFWLGLRSALPDAQFTIHHVIGREDPLLPPRAAVRWSLDGTHAGWGRFGRPSGARVHVMGITHAEFGSLGVAEATLRREYTLIDDTAIWKQILLHTGDVA